MDAGMYPRSLMWVEFGGRFTSRDRAAKAASALLHAEGIDAVRVDERKDQADPSADDLLDTGGEAS